MSSRQIELALRKQRLQLKSAALRDEFAGHALSFAPFFAAADKVRAGAIWLRRNPEITAATAVALVVARPRALFRWARRGFVAWQAWERLGAWLAARRWAR